MVHVRVLVTGGAGFIGRNLCARLAYEHEVTVVDDFRSSSLGSLEEIGVRVKSLDVSDQEVIALGSEGWDSIIHLAAETSVEDSFSRPGEFLSVNTVGTLNLLTVAAANASHFLLASSASVYGRNEESPHSEQSWVQPISPYAASKMAAEGLAYSFSERFELPVAVCRFFNVFGPFQQPDHAYSAVVPKFAAQALREVPLTVFGDGHQSRDLVPVEFVCEVLTRLSESRRNVPQPIPIATGQSIEVGELATRIIQLAASTSSIQYLEGRQGEVRHSQGDPSLLFSLLPGLDVPHLDASLQKTLDWMRGFLGHEVTRD